MINIFKKTSVLLIIISFLFSSSVPAIITFQGRLSDSGAPVTATTNMRFEIVDNLGTAFWQSHTSNSVAVYVNKGAYVVKLGDTLLANMNALDLSNIDRNVTLNLRVYVEGTQLSPDILFSATPYAFIARQAETITANAVAGNSVVAALGKATNSIGIGTSSPAAAALLQLDSTSKAFVPPRMTEAQMNAISSPVNGSIVFNTTQQELYWYEGSYWLPMGGTSANASYDTGWVACSDWTNQHLGSALGGNVTHNLNANLSDLIVKILVSTDGTDSNSFEIKTYSDSGAGSYGITLFQKDDNSLVVRSGASGISYVSSTGGGIAIDIENWYYKVVVYKPNQIVKGVDGSDYVTKAGDTMTGVLTVAATINATAGKLAEGGNPLVPAGSIQMYGGSTAPGGWLLCNGAAVSRTTYASLYAVIGTTYGAGNGSTTFNLPDFRGIFPRGAGTSGKLTNANGTAFSGTLGAYQNDKMQGHRHAMEWTTITGTPNNYPYFSDNDYGPNKNNGTYYGPGSPATDTVNGTPRTGTETNPANLAVNFIIKY